MLHGHAPPWACISGGTAQKVGTNELMCWAFRVRQLAEAEQMYYRALNPDHTPTLETVHNLGARTRRGPLAGIDD